MHPFDQTPGGVTAKKKSYTSPKACKMLEYMDYINLTKLENCLIYAHFLFLSHEHQSAETQCWVYRMDNCMRTLAH